MSFLSSFYPQPVVAGTTEGTFAEGDDARIVGALPAATAGTGSVLAHSGATGATARTLSSRFSEVVNVKDFGAMGDGIADDAPAIRAAFAHADTFKNVTVYFPSGVYNLGTYSDGTSTFPNQGFKQIVNIVNNTNENKNLSIIGDGNVVLQSGLYPLHNGIFPNSGVLTWFSIGPKYNVYLHGIEFNRLIGGSFSPIRALPNNETTSFGLTVAFSVGGGSQITRDVNVEISNCTFREFTKSIFAQLGIGEQVVGHVSIHHNRFFAEWGCNSTSTDNIMPSVDADVAAEFDEFSYNYCVGGPDDYTPIGNTVSGVFTDFKMKDGSILSASLRCAIIGNYVKNYSIESIFWQNRPTQQKESDSHATIVGNVLELNQPLLHNTWGAYGIVVNGPNCIVANNTISGAVTGIFKQSTARNVLIKNNVIKMYSSINRSFNSTSGITMFCTNNNIAGHAIQSLTRNGQTVTVVTSTPHLLSTGDRISITGNPTAAYNVRFNKIIVTNPTTFTFIVEGTPQTPSSGGTVKPASQYLEIIGNSIICDNLNNDNNTFDGTPASWDYDGLMSSAILIGGGTELAYGRVKDNYMKLNGKQNNARKACAILNDCFVDITDNVSDGWDYLYGRITGDTKVKVIKDNIFINGDRLDAMLIANSASDLYESTDYVLSATSAGWWELRGIGAMPTNVIIELHVPNRYDGYVYNFGGTSNDQRLQYTKLEFLRGGAYNNGGGTNPDNVTFRQEHVDHGSPLVTKVAFNTEFNPRIALWIPSVSGKPNKIIIRSSSFAGGDQQAATVVPVFLGSTDVAASINSNWSQITLKKGVIQYARGGELGGFGGKLFGYGVPVLSNSSPSQAPDFVGQQHIDTTNKIIYIAVDTASSSDWKALATWNP